MTARTKERNTVPQEPIHALYFPVAASVTCYKGALACIDVSGRVKPATGTATAVEVVGIFAETVDNSTGAAGDKSVNVNGVTRIQFFTNSTSGDLIAATDVGSDCYAVDDDVVALTSASGTRKRAGRIMGVSSTLGVAVWVGGPPRIQRGRATMVGGTIAVSTGLTIPADASIVVSRSTSGGTAGHLTGARTSASVLTISSSSGTDTSVVEYTITG